MPRMIVGVTLVIWVQKLTLVCKVSRGPEGPPGGQGIHGVQGVTTGGKITKLISGPQEG